MNVINQSSMFPDINSKDDYYNAYGTLSQDKVSRSKSIGEGTGLLSGRRGSNDELIKKKRNAGKSTRPMMQVKNGKLLLVKN